MDVDSETDSNHDTALTLACAGGHEDLVELLLSRGADIGKWNIMIYIRIIYIIQEFIRVINYIVTSIFFKYVF